MIQLWAKEHKPESAFNPRRVSALVLLATARAVLRCSAGPSLNEEATMGSEDGRMLAIWDVVLLGFVMAMMAGVLTGGPQA